MGDRMKQLVDIHVDRCIGCTRCMRVCPTEAIRIKDNKAHLLQERCIFCGNCIANCHKSAYKVTSDSFSNLSKHKINVVLLPISIYGMISNMEELNGIYQTLYNYGFDEVFDLSIVMELINDKIGTLLNHDKTLILSQCPTVVRLIQLKYPSLIPNLLRFDFPFEIGAKLSRKIMSEKYHINPLEIGISYVSECLSNYVAIKEPLGKNKSSVDHVFLFNDIFRNIDYKTEIKQNPLQVAKNGIQFGKIGAYERLNPEVLSVDGIKQVDEVLEKLYVKNLKVKLIEAYSCVGGCIGGNFTLENTFISKWKMNQFGKEIDEQESLAYLNQYQNVLSEDEWYLENSIKPLAPFKLGDSINQSIIKMTQINTILKQLPNIDCCACGSPSCRALAEDIVNNVKTIEDCFILRSKKGE